MNSKNVLKVISVANAFIDGYNNHEYNNDEVNKSHNLNFGKVGMFLDFATVAMELCPIPQVKAAGFILDGIIVAADFEN